MAGTNCCYINNWKDYQELRTFFENSTIKTPRGAKVNLINYLYIYNEDDFTDDKGNPVSHRVFNSPVYMDNWLYHNCKLPFIQEWLEGCYLDDIGYHKGEPEDITGELKIPDYEPCTKVKIIKKGVRRNPQGLFAVDISMDNIEDPEYRDYLYYNGDYDFWVLPGESDEWTISSSFLKCSVRAIIRKVLKTWKLPKGCKVEIQGRCRSDKWILKTG